MKKLILLLALLILILFPTSNSYADALSGSRCETPGQVSQVCTGARDYQILECKRAAEDDCQELLDKKDKLAKSCDDCIPTAYGGLIETCEGRESKRTAAEFDTQCTTPLKQLDEEYSKCRQTYAWKATGKGSCSVEGMVCTPHTIVGDGRRFDECRPGPDAYKVSDDAIASVADKLVQYRLAVKDEAKKIVSIKECGGGPPSQNACIAEKLNSLLKSADKNALLGGLDSNPKVLITPVTLDKSEDLEIVVFTDVLSIPSIKVLGILKTKQVDIYKYPPTQIQIPNRMFYQGDDGTTYRLRVEGNSYRWEIETGRTGLMPSTAVVVGESASIPDGTAYDLKFGSAVFDTSESGKSTEVRTPLTITKSKHTKFAVFYDPEKLYAATVIYEGEVEVTDILSNKTMILKPTDEGKPRMVIVPLAQAEEKTPAAEPASEAQSKSSGKDWILIFILILVIVTVGGFVLYKKGLLKRYLPFLKRFLSSKLHLNPTEKPDSDKKSHE